MTQHPKQKESDGSPRVFLNGFTEWRRILESRIHYGDSWSTLDWLVQTAQKDLQEESEGERLKVREEFAALAVLYDSRRALLQGQVGFRYAVDMVLSKDPIPPLHEVEKTQKRLLEILNTWVDEGAVSLDPLRVQYHFVKRDDLWELDLMQQKAIPGVGIERHHSVGMNFSEPEEEALYLLAQLMSDYASAVNRCPHCHRIFLRLRKNAVYCGRDCHSVAYMRNKRAAEKAGQELPQPKGQKNKSQGQKNTRRHKTPKQKE
ncbi:hypothetical protein PJI16_12870 [Nitrospira sp. MA-1]|nr:hypothetical protein [Nitrospira sp. MA-1]